MTDEPDTDGMDTTGWPQSFKDFVEIIGVGPALKLVDAYAGRDYVSIPKKLPEGHELIQAIGDGPARTLSDHAGGGRMPVPTMADRRMLARKRLVAEATGPTSAVALRLGVSARWVRMVRARRAAKDDRQLSLFKD